MTITLKEAKEYATIASKSGLYPGANIDALTWIIISGDELGLSPSVSLRSFDLIPRGGKTQLYIKPDAMLSLCQRNGMDDYQAPEPTDQYGPVTVTIKRTGYPTAMSVTMTREKAKAAGLTGGNWDRYWYQMSVKTNTATIARKLYADAVGMMYIRDEMPTSDNQTTASEPQPEPPPETAEISTADIMAKVKEFYAGWVGYFRELGANDKEIGVAFKNAFAVDRFSEWPGWNVSTIAGFNSAVDQANYLVNEQYADYQAKHTQPAEEPAAPETVEEKPTNQVARSESKAAAARFIENILAKGYTVSQINEALELPMETDLIEWDGWQAFGAVDKARDKFMNWASNHALTAQQPAQKPKPRKGMFANPPAEGFRTGHPDDYGDQ